jgi:two-component system response regulator CpxR
MRPAKKILLAADDEDQIGDLRYLLYVRGFRVVTAESGGAAVVALSEAPELTFDLLLVMWPLKGATGLLKLAKAIAPDLPAVVITENEDRLPLGFMPDMTLCRAQRTNAEILERIKVLTARKRGPRAQPREIEGTSRG